VQLESCEFHTQTMRYVAECSNGFSFCRVFGGMVNA
jgi:hypothetical protein